MSARHSALPAVPESPAAEVVLPADDVPTPRTGSAPTPVDGTTVATVESAEQTVAAVARGRHRRPPARRAAVYLAAAAVGGVLVNVLLTGGPAAEAQADAATPTVSQAASVAQQLGLTDATATAADGPAEVSAHLGSLQASRAQREADEVTAAQAQSAADQAVLDAQAAAAAEAAARAEAEAQAAALAQAAADAEAAAAAAGPAEFHDYAMAQLGGDASQFSCLENLWGKESGWNPDAQNPTSTAYGIPQFLNSTWAGTGIAKTDNGFRQIDAGLIYIENRYGSPCGAWSHSQAVNWY